MNNQATYDVAIIGGGLAGLALSIQCANAGKKTILFEKEKYPFHRVCGEYISLESWDFLNQLGLSLNSKNLPIIRRLLVSAPNGKSLEQNLPLGGFGLSRFTLDAGLAKLARQSGVELLEETKVTATSFQNDIFTIDSSRSPINARVVAGGFGKRSNMDLRLQRKFTSRKPNKLNNFIGVKYHIQTDWPSDLIALHNFRNGYAGISRIEDGKCCLCYLTTAQNLERNGNSIPELEKKVLWENPFLKKIFASSDKVFQRPVTISQVSFEKKTQVEDHLLMMGDAAGMIAPLCGNGMSMALHSSKLAFVEINRFLNGEFTRSKFEQAYSAQWQHHFSRRLALGRMIQRFFGSPSLSNFLISVLKPFPTVTRQLIRQTHGIPF